LTAQVFIQIYIYQNKNHSNVINLAGRQRMLSQKIVLESLKPQGLQNIETLKSDLNTFVTTHKDLSLGNEEKKIPPPFNNEIKYYYSVVEDNINKIKSSANCVIQSCDQLKESKNVL